MHVLYYRISAGFFSTYTHVLESGLKKWNACRWIFFPWSSHSSQFQGLCSTKKRDLKWKRKKLHNIWQILKHFAETFRLSQNLKLGAVKFCNLYFWGILWKQNNCCEVYIFQISPILPDTTRSISYVERVWSARMYSTCLD